MLNNRRVCAHGACDYTSFSPAGPLAAGTQAPDFTLHSTPDQRVSLREFRGQPVILASTPPIGALCAGTK